MLLLLSTIFNVFRVAARFEDSKKVNQYMIFQSGELFSSNHLFSFLVGSFERRRQIPGLDLSTIILVDSTARAANTGNDAAPCTLCWRADQDREETAGRGRRAESDAAAATDAKGGPPAVIEAVTAILLHRR